MKCSVAVCRDGLPLSCYRWTDFVELTRPRLSIMALFTLAVGFCLADVGPPNLVRLLHTLFGTGLVVAGATALNQVLERHSDAQMARTRNRPLASGRLQPGHVLLLGASLAIAGLLYLAMTSAVSPQRQSSQQSAPRLKPALRIQRMTLRLQAKDDIANTLAGAVSGALPPVIGWTAATNSCDPGAAVLFAILFLWQVPHFLAIAWIYRDDYARAGLCMLPVLGPSGDRTALYMVGYCMALLLVSAIPPALGWAGAVYLLGATILGIGFAACAVGFSHTRSVTQARRVLRASLIYLPALLALLLVDGVLKSCRGTP